MSLLVNGTDYRCANGLCYGLGFVTERLKALQTTINRFAIAGQFKPLAVDGILGPTSLAAAIAAANVGGIVPPTSQEELVQRADEITAGLSAAATLVDVSTAPPPELTASVARAIADCRASSRSPTCDRARAMCRDLRTLPATEGTAVLTPLCDAAFAGPRRAWLIAGAVAIAAATVGGAVWVHHRRR